MKVMMLLILFLNFAQAEVPTVLKVTSFNVGLAHTFVHHAKERLKPITEEIAKSDSDVICLQEAWTKKDRKKIKKALKKAYPFVHMTKIKQMKAKKAPVCRVKELFGKGRFVSCMQKQCGGLDGDEFTDCIINTCGKQLRDLKDSNRECATSLMAQVGRSSIASMITLLTPFKKAGLFAYKGSNGLMLLSKKPMTNVGVIDFSDISTLNRRQALTADISGKKVVCTHLTADLEKTVPYTGLKESWGAENLAQTQRLIKTIKSEENKTTIVAGDFNFSPNYHDEIDAELKPSWTLMMNAGFSDPIAERDMNECTSCSANLLNDEDSSNTIIDHIFVKDGYFTNPSVDFKKVLKVKKKKNIYVETNLSDHFGVSLEVL